MIRWKHHRDMSGIVRLVRTELVPLSPWHHPRDSRLHQEIAARLRKGSTFVVSENRRSPPFAFLHLIVLNQVLFIDLLAVDSTRQNRQWGSQLMARAEQYGRKKGCESVRVFVDDTNERGHRFYNKIGYRTVRHFPTLRCYELNKLL